MKLKKFNTSKLIDILVKMAEGFYYKEEQCEYEKSQNKSKDDKKYNDNISFFDNFVTNSPYQNNSYDKIKTSNTGENNEQNKDQLVLLKKKVTTHFIPPDMLAIKMLFEIYGKEIDDKNISNLNNNELLKLKDKLIEELKNDN